MFNHAQPTFLPAIERLVVVGDVHGDSQRLLHCLYATGVFSKNLEWIAEPHDTVVVQLGDQVDSLSRGGASNAGGWERLPDYEVLTLTAKLDAIARTHGGRVLSLLGNHELMNVYGDFTYVSRHSMDATGADLRRRMFGPGGSIATVLAQRNIVLQIGTWLFVHAGILPHHVAAVGGRLHMINDVVRKALAGQPLDDTEQRVLERTALDQQSMLWTRTYADLAESDPASLDDAVNSVLAQLGCTRIVCGHNTVASISPLTNGKVLLADTGMSRAYPTTGYQVLDVRNPSTQDERVLIVSVSA